MDYETDSDSDSDMNNYNYNYNYNYDNTNNWNTYIGDKINKQNDRHNNSFLDRINKKLESLDDIERSTTIERKNDRDNRIDSFLNLYEKIKSLNSEQERNFEPHQRSSLVTNNWHERKNSSLVSTNRFINSNRKDYSQEVQKMIDVVKVRSSIESQENNNRKDDVIETIQKKKLDGDKEKGIIKKGIVKEILERIERQCTILLVMIMHFTKGFLLLDKFLVFLIPQFDTLQDTLTISKPIKDGDLLVSNRETSALGFFSPGESTNRYVGIWFYKASKQPRVWVANKDNPITDKSRVLSIDLHGNLVLYGEDRKQPI